MNTKRWRWLKMMSYVIAAFGSGMFWVWGMLGLDPGQWVAEGDALIVLIAILTAQTADVLGDHSRHRERAEEIQRHPNTIGDASCQFNARSPIIRCAVNSDGPCDGCPHYQIKKTEPTSRV